jgi:hypothetical protein
MLDTPVPPATRLIAARTVIGNTTSDAPKSFTGVDLCLASSPASWCAGCCFCLAKVVARIKFVHSFNYCRRNAEQELRVRGSVSSEDRQKVMEILRRFGLEESGGSASTSGGPPSPPSTFSWPLASAGTLVGSDEEEPGEPQEEEAAEGFLRDKLDELVRVSVLGAHANARRLAAGHAASARQTGANECKFASRRCSEAARTLTWTAYPRSCGRVLSGQSPLARCDSLALPPACQTVCRSCRGVRLCAFFLVFHRGRMASVVSGRRPAQVS